MIEFYSEYAPEERTMIQYFQKNFRPLVQIEIELRSHELDSFEKIVEKAVDGQSQGRAQALFRCLQY